MTTRRRRCLVLGDGFYEWARQRGRKQPLYMWLRGGAPFTFAGLWERWAGPDGQAIESCTLLTTQPNLIRTFHGSGLAPRLQALHNLGGRVSKS